MPTKKTKKGPAPVVKNTELDAEPGNVRRSMLDVSLEKIREKTLLQRLVVIARLSSGLADRTELAAHYEKFNLQLSKQFVWDHITGLLLLYPSCLLHVLESSRDVLITFLDDLIKLQRRPDGALLEAPKIVFMAYNPCSRLFQQWSYKHMNTAVDEDYGFGETEEESIDEAVNEVLVSLKPIAKHLEQSKKADAKSSQNEFAISPNVLGKLLTREELQTPQQYLKSYNSPLHISMDFGQVKRSSCLTKV